MTVVPQVFLTHILESVDWIERDINGLSYKQFSENVPIQDAVIRRIEIIAEAAKNLPSQIKAKHPEIPWAKVAGMRNKLIHEYFGVDLDLVWSVAKDYLPSLNNQVKNLLTELSSEKM